jgi:hypothetical protein
MNISRQNDMYCVRWSPHINTLDQAHAWCIEQFGTGWGSVSEGTLPDRYYYTETIFSFHRLNHAQWFMIRWANLT